MLLSVQSVELLCLLRWCKYIDGKDLSALFPANLLSELSALRLIQCHSGSGAYILTKRGHRLLDAHLEGLPPATGLSYLSKDIQRRVRIAKIALTAYHAGFSVFHTEISDLDTPRALLLTATSRKKGFNPWGSTRVAALANAGGVGYALHYVCPGVGKLSPTDEANLLMNNTARLRAKSFHLIFAGESYQSLLSELANGAAPSSTGMVSYGELYRRQREPIYLLECSEVGAKQLQVMSVPGYREKLCRAMMKKDYLPPLEGHPEWDAMFRGAPFVVGADMDLRRVKYAIRTAQKAGYPCVGLAGLKGQVAGVLKPRYGQDGYTKIYSIREESLEAIGVGKLYAPSEEQYKTRKGEVIHASLV